MVPKEFLPDHSNVTYLPVQTYIQVLVDTFCVCLSPQELPHNLTARLYMDEELWMPIRVLAKLPSMDNLLISDIMFPFVTESLHNFGSHYMEVDVDRELIRPKWALRSSIFISNVDMYATADQVVGLLEGLRSSVAHPNNPFEFDNISVSKQTANAWSISFKSPSAGPYAAMYMKSKSINGTLVLPMACVHINPPRAAYSNMAIVVMEVDAIQYGDPVVPIGFVQYYSEDPVHMNLLYTTSVMNRQRPTYHEFFHGTGTIPFIAPAFRERSYSNQSFCTQQSIGKTNEIDGESTAKTPPTRDQSEYGSHSSADLDTLDIQGEAKNGTKIITQNSTPSPQSDRGTAQIHDQVVVNHTEDSLGKLPRASEKLSNPNPMNFPLPDEVPDIVEPSEVVKTGEKTAPPTLMASPATIEDRPSPDGEAVDTGKCLTVKTSEHTTGGLEDNAENDAPILYPNPDSLHTPSFANLVHPGTSSSKNRLQNQTVSQRQNQSPPVCGSSSSHPSCLAHQDGGNGTPKSPTEWRVNLREHSNGRYNGKGRNRQSPQGRRKHRKGSGDIPKHDRDGDNSSNGSGSRRRNGQNKKQRNKGQRFKADNQQHNSHRNGLDRERHQDMSNAMSTAAAGKTHFPTREQAGSANENWQTISYKRLRSRRNHSSFSAREENGRNRGRQNGNRRNERSRSTSSHS